MKLHPAFVVAAGVFFTALSAIFIRFSEAPPLVIATYRMGITSVLLTPLFVLERYRKAKANHGSFMAGAAIDTPAMPEEAPAGTPQKTAGPRWAILFSLLSGAFLAAHFASWITSLSHTSVAHATALVTTHPIVVAALGWLVLGERISLKGVLCMIGAIAGGILLVAGDSGGGESTLYGNLLAVGGAVTAGVYLVIGRYARRHLSLNGYTMIVYWTSFVMLALVTSLRNIPLWPYPVREFLIFAALAIFCTLLGHSLFNWALAFLPSTVVSTSILGEPIIATVLALFLFAEVPGPVTAAGGAVMLVSIFLYVRDHTSAGRQARVRDARRS